MKDTELKRKRDRDLFNKYRECLREQRFSSMAEAADYARKQTAPEYYISARTASLLVGRIEKGLSISNLNSNSRKRIKEIYAKYLEYKAHHPESRLSRETILEEIVEQPASEFFVSASRAYHIVMERRLSMLKRCTG